MKKTLILAGILTFILTSSAVIAAPMGIKPLPAPVNKEETKKPSDFKKCEHASKKDRLNLTEEQKKQAHDIRMKGHEKMKPVFEEMKAKRAQAEKITNSNLSEEEKQKQLAPIKNDMQKLRTEAKKIRQENMKEFEAILTPEQKVEFQNIKKEGKEKFEQRKKQHKGHKGDMGGKKFEGKGKPSDKINPAVAPAK